MNLLHRRTRYLFPMLAIGLAALLILLVYRSTDHSESRIKATWLWETILITTEPQEILSFAAKHGVNLIYLQINRNMKFKEYRPFVRAAREKGINIHATGGSPEWAYRKNNESLTQLVSWVKEYNRSSTKDEQFTGIHLDIEPYLLPEWKEDQNQIVQQWVQNMDLFVSNAKKDPNLQVSAALPFWLDDLTVEDDSGQTTTLSKAMMKQLDHITLMAYRDLAEGRDGILHIVDKEIKDADALGKSVVIGVEIAKSSEGEQISFHDKGNAAMADQLSLLDDRLKQHPSFAGVAIHDYVNWRRATE